MCTTAVDLDIFWPHLKPLILTYVIFYLKSHFAVRIIAFCMCLSFYSVVETWEICILINSFLHNKDQMVAMGHLFELFELIFYILCGHNMLMD
jgi:hypothetical protein